LNPLFLKWRIGVADPLFEVSKGLINIVLRPWFGLLTIVLFSYASYSIIHDWERFIGSSRGILSINNAPAFFLSFLFLKCVHELAHGMVCKRFGGYVGDFGLLFVLFMPLTYLDCSSSWRFKSRWSRSLVAAAGMLGEFVLGALAAIFWAKTDPGFWNSVAHTLVIYATVATILFNANPLLRFDGYYILSDCIRMPNLYEHGMRAWNQFCASCLLGIQRQDRVRQGSWIIFYGAACMVWRVLIIATICFSAVCLLHGVGLVLAALTLVASFAPAFKRLRSLSRELQTVEQLRRASVRIALFFALIIALILCPVAVHPSLPGVIRMADEKEIRTLCSGFLTDVYVEDGMFVEKGQLLARLENSDEQLRLKRLRAELVEARLLKQRHLQAGQPYLAASASKGISQLHEEIKSLAFFVDSLEIRAPRDGRVMMEPLERRLGTYIHTGSSLLTIGNPGRWTAVTALPESESRGVAAQVGAPVELLLLGRNCKVTGTIRAVSPQASNRVVYPELTALGGGPIDLYAAGSTESFSDGDELVSPCFYLEIELDESTDNDQIRSGEHVVARLHSSTEEEAVGQYLYRRIRLWAEAIQKRFG
ncbi:MAG: HlyD family efflux transporter periplasmic adaptor subunit, partial [Coraliomargarita sp.]|nr:HlyD family efflux transporter periplasmic adaptor subunit [Coraliomargarita sp.]